MSDLKNKQFMVEEVKPAIRKTIPELVQTVNVLRKKVSKLESLYRSLYAAVEK